MKRYVMKNWKWILGAAIGVILIVLLAVGCSRVDTEEDPSETTLPSESTQPVEETTMPAETTEPTEPEETVPPTIEKTEATVPASEPAETQPPQTEPPATKAPSNQHSNQHKHSYSSKKENPTCTTGGSVTYTCTGCGHSYTDKISATGHKWGEWTVTTAATTESEGTKTRTCGNCGSLETQSIAKLPPVTEPEVTQPAPTEPPKKDPAPTEPAPTEPPVTEPAQTEPPQTEPSTTEAPEPTQCSHQWNQIEYQQEEGHYTENHCVCKCGYKCNSSEEWVAHSNSYSLSDALNYHTSYSIYPDWVVDVPGWVKWKCIHCGEILITESSLYPGT